MILEIPTTLTDLSGIDDKFAKYVVEMINRLLIELYAIDAEKEVETKRNGRPKATLQNGCVVSGMT